MLEPKLRTLCEGPNFATLTTLFESGQPQTQVMWVGCDEDHLYINTEVHRAKFKNVERDPRVTVTVWDSENPYSYVEVRGKVVDTVLGEAAVQHINELSHRYTGNGYSNPITSERAILKIAAERQVIF